MYIELTKFDIELIVNILKDSNHIVKSEIKNPIFSENDVLRLTAVINKVDCLNDRLQAILDTKQTVYKLSN
jgi:hypothetical protein